MSAERTRLRLGVLAIVVGSLFAVLLARMWYLQVLSGDEQRAVADRNALRTVVVPAARGRILDRDGVVLVEERPANVVAVTRTALTAEERADVVATLAPLLGEPADVLAGRLDDPAADRLQPVVVADDVPDDVAIRLRERQDDLPGVVVQRVGVRSYPHGTLAAHLLGHIGQVSAEQLAAAEGDGRGLRAGDLVGRTGVEAAHDHRLRGREGTTTLEVDAAGSPVRVVATDPPVPGADVVLSVDLEVQRAAEQALRDGLEAARGRTFADDGSPLVADAGAVVVLDARDGSVLAMASYPTFDPTLFTDGLSQVELDALNDPAAGVPQLDRATQGLYAPGSTWKLVTAAAALRAGLITPATTVDDRGVYEIPGCGQACTRQNAGRTAFGTVDVRRALAVSSDVFFYGLGTDAWERRSALGPTVIQDLAVELGLGQRTGVGIPGERAGRVPTPAWRAARHAEDPASFPEGGWFVGDNVNLAIGQGEVLVTPLQLANAYATFANGGTRLEPAVALRVERADGTVEAVEPRVGGTVALDPAVRDLVLAGLSDAVVAPGGTGTAAFDGFPFDQLTVAGKTGTAQAPPRQDTALFAAVAPVEAPRYAVAVVMEQAGFGSTAAAPVARAVLEQLATGAGG